MANLKLILGGTAAVIVGAGVAGVAILSSTDFNQYKPLLAEKVKEATGRTLTIDGNLDLSISLSPKVKVDGVTLSNAAWGSQPNMVSVEQFAAQMELLPLLFGNIEISEIRLIKPTILLETDKAGKGNWEMGTTAPEDKAEEEATEASEGGSLPAINKVRIEQASFTYKDGQKGETTTLVIDEMQAQADSLSDPLSLLFRGNFNGHTLTLDGSISTPESLFGNEPTDVNLSLKALGTTATVNGQIKEPTAGKGLTLALNVNSDNITALAQLAGQEVGALPPFDFAATLSDQDTSYTLGGIALKIGGSDLKGDVSVDLGQKTPMITAALSSTLFDTKDVTPASPETAQEPAPTPAKAEGKAQKLFSTDPLPIEALKAVNADITVAMKKVIAGDFALNDITKKVTMKNGLVNNAHSFTMGGGTYQGQTKLDGRKLPVSFSYKATGKDLGLGASLQENKITDLIEGAPTQITFDLNSQGKSLADLMAGLKGKSLINVGEGKINSKYINLAGGDLVSELTGALNPFAEKQDFTPLACMVVNLDFDKGIADYDRRIAIQTDKMNITSSGVINLAEETLNVGIKPEPRGDAVDLGINAGSLAGMVRLKGPLASPGIGVDALGTAKAAAGIAGAIATGGVSLLISGLTDKALADSTPCLTALGHKKSNTDSAPAQGGTEQKKSQGGIGGLLNLFGGDN